MSRNVLDLPQGTEVLINKSLCMSILPEHLEQMQRSIGEEIAK